MFDKVMECRSLQSRLDQSESEDFKIAFVSLFMAAKHDDPRYAYFECFITKVRQAVKDDRELLIALH